MGFKLEGPKTLEKGQIIYLRDEQGKTIAEVPYTGREFYSVALRMDSDWRPMKTLALHMGQELPADSTLMVCVGDRSASAKLPLPWIAAPACSMPRPCWTRWIATM